MPEWAVYGYQWLEANNLYKAVVAFGVTIALSAFLSAFLRPWRTWGRHRELQEKIADHLDTSTPGGLSDLVKALRELTGDLKDGDSPDDNGSDPDEHGRFQVRDMKAFTEHVIPDPVHGGGSATHR